MDITVLPIGFILLMGKTPMELFIAGGPVMWPMIFLSFVALTVVVERVVFALREKTRRQPKVVHQMLDLIEAGDFEGADAAGQGSTDFVAHVLVAALDHREGAMNDAFARQASVEIARYTQGLVVLDTAITAAPLLGLLGTVTGMMGSFGKITGEMGAPTAITGGIAEALVATATGLLVAVTSLVPYNWLNSMVEEARREIEEAGMSLELALKRSEGEATGGAAAAV